MSKMMLIIHYPVVVKFAGQDELIYSADRDSFYQEYQRQGPYLTAEDLFIDSSGRAFQLQLLGQDAASQPALVQQFELPELTTLVQAHFFALAQSCVVKIQAPSIAALFELVKDAD